MIIVIKESQFDSDYNEDNSFSKNNDASKFSKTSSYLKKNGFKPLYCKKYANLLKNKYSNNLNLITDFNKNNIILSHLSLKRKEFLIERFDLIFKQFDNKLKQLKKSLIN